MPNVTTGQEYVNSMSWDTKVDGLVEKKKAQWHELRYPNLTDWSKKAQWYDELGSLPSIA